MFIGPECFALSRGFLVSFFLLCQLTWVLPCIFLLWHPSPTPELSFMRSQNASRLLNLKGFAGPFKVLGNGDLSLLKIIHGEWSTLRPTLRDEFVANGLSEPSERTCFIWLPECYNLARHEQITHIVEEAIGPNVLLYGVTIWDGENEVLQQFHRDTDVAGCAKTLNFVSGARVQLISQSYKISDRLLQVFLKLLTYIEGASMKYPSKTDQVANFNKLFTTRVRKLVRNADIELESFEAADGYGVFIKGGTVFRLGEIMEGRRGLLMQFVSAECKVREPRRLSWGVQGTSFSLYMPPVLLVAGAITEYSQYNDVRLHLVKKEAMNVKSGRFDVLGVSFKRESKRIGSFGSSKIHGVAVFSEGNASASWQERGMWKMRKVGDASTSVMSLGNIEQFHISKRSSSTKFHNVASNGQQVLVVLRDGLVYSRWVTHGEHRYSEVLELRPGSAVLLAPQFMHALKSLGPDTTFMSFSWVAYKDEVPFKVTNQFKFMSFRQDCLSKELLGYGNTKATEGRTIKLDGGQAYDPDNNENCDVLVFVIEGTLLQVLPSNATLQSPDVLLVPADHSCVLWNTGSKLVRLFAMHLCHFNDDMQLLSSYGASGKIF